MKCLLIFLPVLLGEKLRFKKLEPKQPEIFKGPLSEGCQSEAYPSERVLYEPKTYQINLDLDPSERWTAIGKDYAEHVQALLKVVIGVVNKIDDRLVPFVLKVKQIVCVVSLADPFESETEHLNLEFAEIGRVSSRKLCRRDDWPGQSC